MFMFIAVGLPTNSVCFKFSTKGSASVSKPRLHCRSKKKESFALFTLRRKNWKRRFHSENGSNVFRSHYAGKNWKWSIHRLFEFVSEKNWSREISGLSNVILFEKLHAHSREVKHDVYGKRQTAKMKLLTSVFSSLYIRIKIFVFAVKSKRHFSIFVWFT